MLAVIAVAMVALVLVKNRREARVEQMYRAAVANSHSYAVEAPAHNVGPAPLGQVLTMTGDSGFTARLRVVPGNDAASYTVRIQNGGTKPFDGSFSKSGAVLYTDQGRFYRPEIQILPTTTASPSAIGPNAEASLALTFKIPAQARPAGLVLSLRLGRYYPDASWALTP